MNLIVRTTIVRSASVPTDAPAARVRAEVTR